MYECMLSFMQICALTNLKGGVGKTSETLGLAGAAAAHGLHVLVIDLDPQANATLCLAPELDVDTSLTINDVMVADQPGAITDAIQSTTWPGVDLVAAQLELDAREADAAANATHRLRRALRGLTNYDLVLIDCRPSVGRLATNALVAADMAVIVTDPERAAIRGIGEAVRHIEVVAEDLNPRLRLAGIVVNRMDARKTEATFRLDEIRQAYGATVWEPVIPDRTVVAQAFGAGVPVHSLSGPAAQDVAAAYASHLTRLLDTGEKNP